VSRLEILGRRFLEKLGSPQRRVESQKEGSGKPAEPVQQQREILAGGEHGIGEIAGATLKIVASHAVFAP
jgi:hypothetical protein